MPPDVLASSQTDYTLPPALATAPAGSPFTGDYIPTTAAAAPAAGRKPAKAKRARLVAKLTRRGRVFTVAGTAPAKARVTIALLRGGRKVATKRVKASAKGKFRVTFRGKRKGTYRAAVSIRSVGKLLTRRTGISRLR